MPVYVDTPTHKPGRLRVCRMVADTLTELNVMADSMGIRRRRMIEREVTPYYELCLRERTSAIQMGAIEVPRLALTETFRVLAKAPTPPESPH